MTFQDSCGDVARRECSPRSGPVLCKFWISAQPDLSLHHAAPFSICQPTPCWEALMSLDQADVSERRAASSGKCHLRRALTRQRTRFLFADVHTNSRVRACGETRSPVRVIGLVRFEHLVEPFFCMRVKIGAKEMDLAAYPEDRMHPRSPRVDI